jgi:hypothetical protein
MPLGLFVGVVWLLVAGYWLANSFRSASGASSPQQAVNRLLNAVEANDPVGVAQVLQPDETRLLGLDSAAVLRQFRRFGVSGAGVRSVKKRDHLQRDWSVSLDLGSLRSSERSGVEVLGVVQVPFPEITFNPLEGRIAGALNNASTGRWMRSVLSPSGKDSDSGIVLAVIQQHHRWYVSLTKTLARSWRGRANRNSPSPRPTVADKPPSNSPTGAESPEKAVQLWLNAAAQLDEKSLFALTNPLEAQAFPSDAIEVLWGERISKLQRQFELSIPNVTEPSETSVTRFGKRVIVPVTIRDAKFALTEPGAEPFIAQYHEGCLVILSGSKATKHCGRQIPRFGEQFSIPVSKPTIDRFAGRLDSLAAARKSLPGVVAVKRSGRWFVSPTQTVLLNAVTGLSNAKRADVEALAGDIKKAISSDG